MMICVNLRHYVAIWVIRHIGAYDMGVLIWLF